ncbi:hypothetical protein CKM354_000147800 [Cercospora kikuchii]|uniref:BZIP domain-containing protein n=1 Tax=Cercospora kikuchii TaxID=84275 RepID=A0A9P3C7D4_9PEZI|nr:uncharacterized protein CKM354_000147800 [Cercospora kikuchii]GIZ38052.1 hypothetical protein CKM354_000147800 [Cercospora kikuchii]
MQSQRPLAAEGSSLAATAGASEHDTAMQSSGAPSTMPQRKKKPGPKRDSKPAPNEKLERNRQAQRTHRERKEQYTKDLELEVMRLKELFVQTTRERDDAIQSRDAAMLERDRLREENLRLREHVQPAAATSSAGTDSGYESMSWTCDATRTNSFSDASGFPSMTANAPLQEVADRAPLASTHRLSIWDTEETRGFASDGPMLDVPTSQTIMACQRSSTSTEPITVKLAQELPAVELDYDELGLDFILTLERPCMGHIHYLHVRAHNYQASEDGGMAGQPMEVPDDGENQHISGHAMMATAPLYTDIIERPGSRYPCQMPQLKRKDLINLLNLSAALEISEPEIPPVRAWIKLMQDSRTRGFSAHDFEVLKASLLHKIHCYRFGAVVDEHDIDDALTQVCQVKEAAAVAAASPRANPRKFEP